MKKAHGQPDLGKELQQELNGCKGSFAVREADQEPCREPGEFVHALSGNDGAQDTHARHAISADKDMEPSESFIWLLQWHSLFWQYVGPSCSTCARLQDGGIKHDQSANTSLPTVTHIPRCTVSLSIYFLSAP